MWAVGSIATLTYLAAVLLELAMMPSCHCVLKVLEDEKLADNAAKLGEIFRREMKTLDKQVVKDVRGKGLLNAVEIEEESGWLFNRPYSNRRLVCRECDQCTYIELGFIWCCVVAIDTIAFVMYSQKFSFVCYAKMNVYY